jgi:hypothetical protein
MKILGRFSRSKAVAAVAAVALVATAVSGSAKVASAAQPDLSIQRITVNAATKGVTVRMNNATAPTGTWFYTSMAVCNTTNWYCEYSYMFHSALGAGEDGLVTRPGFAGANYAYACVDQHWTVALVSNRIAESNEGNNCKAESFAPLS